MKITVLSSEAVSHDRAGAMRTADKGAVVINADEKRRYVLMRYDAYRALGGHAPSLREALVHPESDDIEFDPPRLSIKLREIDLS